MPDHFNPYNTWLDIPETQPNHYRLLGVPVFEKDDAVINHAADQRMIFLRTFQGGERGQELRALMNEIAAACVLLCDPAKKQEYDNDLFHSEFADSAHEETKAFDSDEGFVAALSPDVFQPYDDEELLSPAEENSTLFKTGFFKSTDQAVILFCIVFLIGWMILFVGGCGLIYLLNRSV